jgi:7,8-dihydropterin-6-yl-methyl-4-(beta-D-ribofuranosyl)aminobenzene 5'-phosphate synthase
MTRVVRGIAGVACAALAVWTVARAQGRSPQILGDPSGLTGVTARSGIDRPVTIRVIYDNFVKTPGLTADWGYAILIDGLEKRVLFDTGAKPDVFAGNVEKMGLDLSRVDLLALSHQHTDHTGGIPAFATMRRDIPVLMPQRVTDAFRAQMEASGLRPVVAGAPAMICPHLYTSGQFDHAIPEQALVLDTRQGLVVMTGCSHPGIVAMLRTVRAAFGKNVSTVFGGFHLLEKSEQETAAIIADMKALGVERCGATHCTGDAQIAQFKRAFGPDYIELGVGNTIVLR